MLSPNTSNTNAHLFKVADISVFSTVCAILSNMKGTATTAIAGIKVLIDSYGFHGRVAFPPIIAKDSMRKVGARVVKKVD